MLDSEILGYESTPMSCIQCIPFDCGNGMACSVCGKRIGSNAVMGTHTSFAQYSTGLRVILVGHGTHDPEDGEFRIPFGVTIFFKVAHKSNSMGLTTAVEFDPRFTRRTGIYLGEYRLWPMVGEQLHLANATSYQDAEQNRHLFQTTRGVFDNREVWMYSGSSGEGIRLSHIVAKVKELMVPPVPLEIVWLACREVARNADVRSKMVFKPSEPPITSTA